MNTYLLLKLVHVLSSTLLFGTGLGTAFYLWRADRGGQPIVIASVARQVVIADWCFTTPAVILQPLTGLALLHQLGIPLHASWVVASLILYVLIGLCWLPVVWIQIRIARLASLAASDQTELPARYHRLMHIWYMLGWPAFLGVLVVFWLMVFKPQLW
ncbi:DUF2269 family protein [Dokdonella sp.]|uniref:DUF2269 family protein n=1 Tax=Dokdonella sp. TaxID=2291710 RepID=UPI003528195B